MRFSSLGLFSLLLLPAFGNAAYAQSTVRLSPFSLHPNLPVAATGASFGDSEAVDVYLDTVDTALVVSSTTGTFSTTVQVPASEQPGTHYITAVGRKSGDAAQASFTVSTPWPQQGFGMAGRSWNPWENTLSPSTVGTLGLLWSTPTDPVYSSPVVAGGHAYVATPSGVKSINCVTGGVIWTTALSGSFYSSPAFANNTIYAASNAGGVYALNTSGTKLWGVLTTTDFAYASPVVANGLVYIGDSTGNMYALNASTGATVWKNATSGQAIYSTAAVVGGIVYFGSYSGMVYALNASTGATLWTYTTGAQIRGTPVVNGGVVYVGSFDYYFYALVARGANGGTLRWKNEMGYDIWSSAAQADGAVFAASAGGTVYAYDPRTGATIWSYATGQTIYTDVSVANGVVYASSNDGTLYALNDATGALLWSADLGDPAWGRPIVSDGVVYVNSQQGSTFAFALQAGNNVLRPIRHAPAISTLRPDYNLKADLKN